MPFFVIKKGLVLLEWKYFPTPKILDPNKRGNAHARSILFFTIGNMIRQQAAAPNHIVDYYYRLKKGPHPKRDKVAKVACMNKTIKCLLVMIKANQRYDYSYHGLKVQ